MTTPDPTFHPGIDAEPALILVVEDDATQRALFRAHLKREGYDVLEAENGISALEIIAANEPDAIIMDVQMPVMDGLTCTKQLKAKSSTAHIPIIMASAASDGDDVVAGLEAGADEYITKPLDAKVFRLRVRSMVRLARAHKALHKSTNELGQQNRDLGIILDLSFNLNADGRIENVMRHVVEAAAEFTGCRSVALLLPEPEGTCLKLAHYNCAGMQPPKNLVIPVGTGISGRAFQAVNPIVYEKEQRIFENLDPQEAALFPGSPVLAAPLCTAEETIGVLTVASRILNQPFSPKELAYLDMIANLAASSIRDIQTRRDRDDAHESIVFALAKLAEHRDNDTGKHLDRVTQYCLTLADELRKKEEYAEVIDETFLRSLKLAVPLHDIGKVAVPDNILLKPGRLSPEEMAIMRTHVDFGEETIRSVRQRAPNSHFLKIAEEVCSGHHEWFNGKGYPNGVAGHDIPLSARLAAIADVYDALTSKRAYKEAMPHEKAYNIIVTSSGTQFDPEVVQAFIDREQEFISLAKELADADPAQASDSSPVSPQASPGGRC